jgi:transcriptional regulator with XRE-family HTH domain
MYGIVCGTDSTTFIAGDDVMTDIQKSKLCHGLKTIRKKRKITQQAAADFLGIPRTALTQIENGNRAINTLEIAKLAKLYDCTVEELIEHNDIWDPWDAYDDACRKLIIAFLDKYYPDESIDTVYFVGDEKYTGVFMTDDERFYDIGFVAECFQYDATFEDICSYQDYGLDCSLANRDCGISFKNWVKHPERRIPIEDQPFTTEERLKQLLKKCIPALEGITQYESLLWDVKVGIGIEDAVW